MTNLNTKGDTMNDVIYSIDVRVSQEQDCNIGDIADLLDVTTNGNASVINVRQENENEETKDAIYKILEAKDARITHLLGLLGQAEEIVDWVITSEVDAFPIWLFRQAEIVKAKIEKEKAK